MANEFDVVVIGGGPAGEIAAQGAAAAGLSTAIVEGERLGGECSFWACVPSKTLLRPGDVHTTAHGTPGMRSLVRGPIEAAAVFQYRDQMTHGGDDSSQADWVKGANVSIVRGHGRFVGPRKLQITEGNGRTYEVTARKAVVIATGTHTRFPDVRGIRDLKPWTNREATSAHAAPRRLLILGGGPVALEMSQAWSSLGTEAITILERGDRLLSRMEPFVGEMVAASLKSLGIDLRLRTQVKQVQRGPSGEVVATLDSGATLTGDEILVSTGRLPATDDLGLETIGLKPGERIEVDESLRATGVPDGWLYAVGDANGRNLLTHMGKYQGRILGEVFKGRKATAWADHSATPQIIFTHPQVASVGLTEAVARQKGMAIRTARVSLEDVTGYSVYGPNWKGVAQLVVDTGRNVIVGATFVGLDVGEMIHSATIAIVGEVPIDRLWHAVPPFPSVSEVWLRLLEQLAAG